MKISRNFFALLIFLVGSSLVAESMYVPLSQVFPGQVRYSNMNVLDKIDKAKAKGEAKCDDTQCKFKFDKGQSILSLKKALPVVKAPFGLVLLDGHHDTLASIRLGAKTIPVFIKEDLSNLSEEEFWIQSSQKGWSYPYAIGGAWQVPVPEKGFGQLVNDPNRYFAAITARKCDLSTDAPEESRGALYPLWIKVGIDVPFIEFKISDMLNNNGFVYDEQKGQGDLDQSIEKARDVLMKNRVPQLKLLESRQNYLDIKNLCSMPSLPTTVGTSE